MSASAAEPSFGENGATAPNGFPYDIEPLPHADVPALADRVRPEIIKSCAVALRRMGGTRLISVTSSTRGEGRTTVACALALAAAQGAKTILIELDFENARLAEHARHASGPGMADLLRGDATVDQCLQRVGPDLEVIVAGWARESLDSLVKGLPAVMAALRSRYDTNPDDHNTTIIVADLAPLDAGISTTRVADFFSTPVLVVRAGGVETQSIEQSAAVLGRKPFVVLNGTGKGPTRRQRRKRRRRAARK